MSSLIQSHSAYALTFDILGYLSRTEGDGQMSVAEAQYLIQDIQPNVLYTDNLDELKQLTLRELYALLTAIIVTKYDYKEECKAVLRLISETLIDERHLQLMTAKQRISAGTDEIRSPFASALQLDSPETSTLDEPANIGLSADKPVDQCANCAEELTEVLAKIDDMTAIIAQHEQTIAECTESLHASNNYIEEQRIRHDEIVKKYQSRYARAVQKVHALRDELATFKTAMGLIDEDNNHSKSIFNK